MSFNVRFDTPADGDDAWPRRRDFVASTVRVHRPDVVGLQEPLEHQLDYLRSALPAYEWVGVGRLGGTDGEYCPVGYRAKRFERLETDTFWLSETPSEPGSLGWDAEYSRIATWVRLRDRETDTRFRVCNTHFDHSGASARQESARLVAERLADDPTVVVTGDLNCEPGSPPYRRLSDDLDDARAAARHGHHGPDGTFHSFDGEPTARLDYVFVRGMGVRQHATLADRRGRRYPSDHFPVVAELEFLKG